MTMDSLKLYADLAPWWPLLSPPEEYVEEAAELLEALGQEEDGPARTLLELGSGGGSLAFHLKAHFALTLTDVSPGMLAISRALNPECEHLVGDMTSLRLGRTFDRVLVHDAIMYATERSAARATVATAVAHCRPGGRVVLVPDCVRETFEPGTDTGGHDEADGRGLRYLEWSWDQDPSDEHFEVTYTLVLREADGTTTVSHERHHNGLFGRDEWLTWLREAGCEAHSRRDSWGRDVFVGVRT
jgi:SAM-dependent methyltransferase